MENPEETIRDSKTNIPISALIISYHLLKWLEQVSRTLAVLSKQEKFPHTTHSQYWRRSIEIAFAHLY